MYCSSVIDFAFAHSTYAAVFVPVSTTKALRLRNLDRNCAR